MKSNRKTRKYRKKRSIRRRKYVARGGNKDEQQDVGFIVTRCVMKPEQQILYQDCYKAIRKFHPDLKIVFIDDNYDKNILEDFPMTNVEIIQSEFPGAGEYLPYYYLLKRKLFKKAIMLQDSMILTTAIPFDKVDDFMFLYELGSERERKWDLEENPNPVEDLLNKTKKSGELKALYHDFNNPSWVGAWGSCMVITYDFLTKIEDTVGILIWSTILTNRRLRTALERAIGLICIYVKGKSSPYSLFGDIDNMQVIKEPGWGKYTLEMYLQDKTRIKDNIIKVWNGRGV